jgi:hypothetical protein
LTTFTLTPRDRFLAALAGRAVDRVPFVIWNNKLPGEPVNSRLLDAGACIVNKSTVYEVETPGVRIETDRLEPRDGCPRLKTAFHTSAGSLTMVERHVPGTVWLETMPFKEACDYGPLEALVKSRTYRACYDRFARDDSMYGGRSIARPEAIHTPFQDLICKYMGAETFCIEWADNRGRLLKLCETVAEDRRKRLRLVAESAAAYVIIEGNVISGLAGGGMFEEYHMPYIQEACDILHEKGKFAGAHLDGDNTPLADAIARTRLDLVESFTVPPGCPMPLAQAQRFWPEKTIQVNLPSTIHADGPGAVRRAAEELLEKAVSRRRLVVGVSEDIPGGGIKTLVELAKTVLKKR